MKAFDVSFDDQFALYKQINQLDIVQMTTMLKQYPALLLSWESFLIHYNLCLTEDRQTND